jgi:hypothetical protein
MRSEPFDKLRAAPVERRIKRYPDVGALRLIPKSVKSNAPAAVIVSSTSPIV